MHINESGCSVIENSDKIDETRYQSYLEFVEEAKSYKEKIKYQGTKTESSSKKHNDNIAVKISAHKRKSARNTLKQNVYKDIYNEEID